MRKLPLIALFGLSSLLFSCEDDSPAVNPGQELPTDFSELTVEQNKAKLEENGIDMVHHLEDLKNVQGVDVASHLASLLMNSEETPEGGRILQSLSDLQAGKTSVQQVFTAMRLKGDMPTGEPQSLQEFFDIYAGTYTWVASASDWDYVAGGDDVTFKFPSTEGGTSNNATFSMRDYQGTTVSNPIEGYEGDLPTNLIIDLTVDGSKLIEYSFVATYNNNGEPTSLNTSLTVAPFTFSIQQTNNTEVVAVDYSLKKGSTVLIAFGSNANGHFDFDTMNTSEDPDDVISTGSAYFQLLNIKIAGNVNVAEMMADINQIDYENDPSAFEKEIAAYNEHYQLVVFYVDSNKIIADTEFYGYTDTYSYEYYDYNTGEWVVEVVESKEIGIRLIFADGSKSDLDNYIETGFEDLSEELEAFFQSLEE